MSRPVRENEQSGAAPSRSQWAAKAGSQDFPLTPDPVTRIVDQETPTQIMQREVKIEQAQLLRQRIEGASALVLVEFGGLTVADADALRTQFREANCSYRVYKNSVVRYAVAGTRHEPITPLLKGVTGLAFHLDDPGAPARVVRDFVKSNDKVRLKGAVVDGEMIDASRAGALADMPGPNELKATLLQLMLTPATQMVRVLSAPVRDFLNVLNAKKDKDAA